jgi:hypothetical protein
MSCRLKPNSSWAIPNRPVWRGRQRATTRNWTCRSAFGAASIARPAVFAGPDSLPYQIFLMFMAERKGHNRVAFRPKGQRPGQFLHPVSSYPHSPNQSSNSEVAFSRPDSRKNGEPDDVRTMSTMLGAAKPIVLYSACLKRSSSVRGSCRSGLYGMSKRLTSVISGLMLLGVAIGAVAYLYRFKQSLLRDPNSVTEVVTRPPSCTITVSSATLVWTSHNAAVASIEEVGSVPLNGSRNVSSSQTTVHTLTVSDVDGRTGSCTTTAIADPPLSVTIAPGREFVASSYVHTPLSEKAEIDPMSATWVASLQRQIRQYFGVASVNTHEYTPSIYIVGPNQPTVAIKPSRPDDSTFSDWGRPLADELKAVPLPDDFQPSPGTDHEAIIYQPSTGHYWEMWAAYKTGRKVTDSAGRSVDEWAAGWGGYIADLATNPGYFQPNPTNGYKYGTQASGLPFLSSLMTIEEQRRGVINHPLNLGIVETRAGVWNPPAQRTDGWINSRNAIPEGVTFRLPANLNLDAIDMDSYARMVARAAQKYGMIVSDTSGATTLRAENPGGRYRVDPYNGPSGILNCPAGSDPVNPPASCWPDSNGRLRGFPWDKLVALKTHLVRP